MGVEFYKADESGKALPSWASKQWLHSLYFVIASLNCIYRLSGFLFTCWIKIFLNILRDCNEVNLIHGACLL